MHGVWVERLWCTCIECHFLALSVRVGRDTDDDDASSHGAPGDHWTKGDKGVEGVKSVDSVLRALMGG